MTEEKKPKKSVLETWAADGAKLYYVRFQTPVPTSVNQEPVFEFSLENKQSKYVVDSIIYTQHGVIWRCRQETDITPLANVVYARSLS